jgi:Ras-related protein Rab-24
LFVWDTAGQERFRQIARMYYKDVQGVLVCFDLTDEESFTKLNFWLQDLQYHAPEKIVKILCGLKLDLVESLESSSANIRESTRSMGAMLRGASEVGGGMR